VNRLFLPRVQLWWRRAGWVLPVLGVFAGLLLQSLTDQADNWLYEEGTAPFVSAGAATALLAAIGGGMVTFTGLVFTFVVLLLQFGSSQYSPRTVSYFLRTRLLQWVLTIFILTITFCFLGLIEVGSGGRDDFEPQTTVLVSVVLLLVSLIAFVTMLQAVGGKIRVDRVLSDIGRTSRRQLRSSFTVRGRGITTLPKLPASAAASVDVRFEAPPGQVVGFDIHRLLQLADRHSAHLDLRLFIGDAVAYGAVIGSVASATPVSARAVSSMLIIDVERSLRHDPLYALRLLVDIAIRALSPAVNDPTTAVRSLDEIEGVLRVAAYQRLGPLALRRGSGTLIVASPTWEDFLDLALAEIIVFGERQPQITRRVIALLSDLEGDVPPERRAGLERYQRQLVERVSRYADGEQRQFALRGDRQGLGGGR
jgi:uncharacterized membrane protein